MTIKTSKGRCKHGEFDLLSGCPQCVSERLAEQLKEKLKTNIVKVKYVSESTGEVSAKAYTYYTAESLQVGDIVTVPVRDTTGKAQVSAIDVSVSEIEAFKDSVKTIPTGSVKDKAIPYVMPKEIRGVKISPNAARMVDDIAEKLQEPEPVDYSHPAFSPDPNAWRTGEEEGRTVATETSIALRPGEDIEVHSYFEESRKMLEYAETRVIKTLEDARLATDDLSAISRLKKAMEAKRKEALSPHEAQVKAIRDTYNYLMTPVLEAERITKEKQLAFLREQERRQQEQEAINRKRIEAAQQEMQLTGELTESVNLVEVQEAPQKVTADFGSSGLVEHWTYEVVDFALVPDEYKVIDSAMLNAIARKHHDAKKIPGIIFKNEPYLATRTK